MLCGGKATARYSVEWTEHKFYGLPLYSYWAYDSADILQVSEDFSSTGLELHG